MATLAARLADTVSWAGAPGSIEFPDSIAGTVIVVTITQGTPPYSNAGGYEFRPAAQGNTYEVRGRDGFPGSFGTYTYEKLGPTQARLEVVDSITGPAVVHTQSLLLITPTSGTYTLQNSQGAGSQSGSFRLVTPPPEGPAWAWVTVAQGTGTVFVNTSRLDPAGNLYLVGMFTGDLQFGTTRLRSKSANLLTLPPEASDAFVAKVGSDGAFRWALALGDTGYNEAWGVDVDETGHLVVTGVFEGTAAFGAHTLTSEGFGDVFVLRLTSDGDVVWAQRAGGTGHDGGWSVAIGPGGGSYVCGQFDGTARFGETTLNATGTPPLTTDAFVARYDDAGRVVWAVAMGGPAYDAAYSIARDRLSGNWVATGHTGGAGRFGALTVSTEPGVDSVFVSQFSSEGEFQWVRTSGAAASGWVWGAGLAMTGSGGGYVAGLFTGTNHFDGTTLISDQDHSAPEMSPDGFLSRFTPTGQFTGAIGFGGPDFDEAWNVATDPQENAFVVGTIEGDATFNRYTVSVSSDDPEGFWDGFLAKIDSTGSVRWIKQARDSGDSSIRGVVHDGRDGIIVAGQFGGVLRLDALEFNGGEGQSLFIAKLIDPDALPSPPEIVVSPGSQRVVIGRRVVLRVVARGTVPLSHQWEKEGVAMAGATAAELVIEPFQNLDAGRYRVRVSNSLGSATSDVAVLSVDEGPPVLAAWRAGGTGDDLALAVGLSSSERTLLAGRFQGSLVAGAATLVSRGEDDVLAGALDGAGEFLWASQAGGGRIDEGRRLAPLPDGGAMVAGRFAGLSWFGNAEFNRGESEEAFLSRFGPDGTFLWTLVAGGPGSDAGSAVATDGEGRVFWGGDFQGAATFGSIALQAAGGSDVFVSRVTADGSVDWAERLGGAGDDGLHALATTPDGDVWMVGHFAGTAGFGVHHLDSSGNTDAFVLRADRRGAVQWAGRFGGPDEDSAQALALDVGGKTVVAGFFHGTAAFGPIMLTSRGGRDAFVGRFDDDGRPLWVLGLGGTAEDSAWALAPASDGGVYVAGHFSGTAVFGGFQLTSLGGTDAYLAKVDPSGRVVWVKQVGGGGNDEGRGVASNPGGSVVFAGGFAGSARIEGITLDAAAGSRDLFVVHLEDASAPVILAQPAIQSAVEGGLAVFRVEASGSHPLIYQWRKNGAVVPGATGAILRLVDVKSEDAGSYVVEVRNSLGTVTSSPASLQVRPLPGEVDRGFVADLSSSIPFAGRPVVWTLAQQDDGRIVVAAPSLDGGIARLHADGRRDFSFNPGQGIDERNGSIRAIAIQPDRKILIGGDFDRVDGAPRPGLARLHPDGSLDRDFNLAIDRSFSPATDGALTSILLDSEHRILIGGGFEAVNGEPRPGVARLHPDGSLDATFVPPPQLPLDVKVLALDQQGGVLVGGVGREGGPNGGGDESLMAIPDEPAPSLVRLDTAGRPDAAFQPVIAFVETFLPIAYPGEVHALGVQDDGRIVVGGSFTEVNGIPRTGVARLLPDGATDATFQTPSGILSEDSFKFGLLGPGEVRALALQADGKILVGGLFDRVDALARQAVARLNPDGSVDRFFDPGQGAETAQPTSSVAVLTLGIQGDGGVLVGGAFDRFDGALNSGLVRLAGGDPQPYAPYLLADPTDLLVVAGGTVQLEVRARGVPPPLFEWRLNGTPIPDITGSSVTIPSAQARDAGDYEAIVWNREGQVSSRFHLEVVPPEAPFRFQQAESLRGFHTIPFGAVFEVAVDPQGNTLFTGFVQGMAKVGGTVLTNDGTSTDLVLVKQSPTGEILWTTWGRPSGDGTGFHQARLAVDATGHAWVLGRFEADQAIFGTEGITLRRGSGPAHETNFVMRCDAQGRVLWARTHPGAIAGGPDGFEAIGVDQQGRAIVATEIFGGIHFADLEIEDTGAAGSVVVAAYDAQGQPRWGRAILGSMLSVDDMAVDATGNAYLLGAFPGGGSSIDFSGRIVEPEGFGDQLFLAKYTSAGPIEWVRTFSGDGMLSAHSVLARPGGGAVLAGEFDSWIDLGGVVLTNAFARPTEPETPVFIAQVNTLGDVVSAIRQSGGEGAGLGGTRLATTLRGEILAAGRFWDAGQFGHVFLPRDEEISERTYLAKYDSVGNLMWVRTIAGSWFTDIETLSADAQGHIVVGGNLSAPVALDEFAVNGECCDDRFLARLAPEVPQRAPGILHSRGRAVHEGGAVELRVFAASTTLVRHQWFFNDTPLPAATGETLTLSPFDAAQIGDYRVEVSNAVGTTRGSAIALSLAPPLAILGVRQESNGFSVTVFALKGGRSYALHSSENLRTWTWVTSQGGLTDDGPITLRDSSPHAARRFYRVSSSDWVDDLVSPGP